MLKRNNKHKRYAYTTHKIKINIIYNIPSCFYPTITYR